MTTTTDDGNNSTTRKILDSGAAAAANEDIRCVMFELLLFLFVCCAHKTYRRNKKPA